MDLVNYIDNNPRAIFFILMSLVIVLMIWLFSPNLVYLLHKQWFRWRKDDEGSLKVIQVPLKAVQLRKYYQHHIERYDLEKHGPETIMNRVKEEMSKDLLESAKHFIHFEIHEQDNRSTKIEAELVVYKRQE